MRWVDAFIVVKRAATNVKGCETNIDERENEIDDGSDERWPKGQFSLPSDNRDLVHLCCYTT